MSIRQKPSARITRPRPWAIGAVTIAIASLPITACSDDSADSVVTGTVEPTVSITQRSATPTSTTSSATPTTADRQPAIGHVSGADETSVRYLVPPGWEADSPIARVIDSEPRVAVRFLDVANIYSDPCQWTRFDPPVGPTVDDLVSALQDVPAFEVTPPHDVTVDGFTGKYLEFTFDRYEEGACRDDRFALWDDTGAANPDEGPHWWAQGPEQTTRVWILDVAGTRLVIEGFHHPNTPAHHRAAIDEIVNSIEIG